MIKSVHQNLLESGEGILDVIGDFHDGFRYRIEQIMTRQWLEIREIYVGTGK
jgi:hypothetical protein